MQIISLVGAKTQGLDGHSELARHLKVKNWPLMEQTLTELINRFKSMRDFRLQLKPFSKINS